MPVCARRSTQAPPFTNAPTPFTARSTTQRSKKLETTDSAIVRWRAPLTAPSTMIRSNHEKNAHHP